MKKIVKYGLIGFVGLGVLGAILPDQPVQNAKVDKAALMKFYGGMDTSDRENFGWGSEGWDEGRWYATRQKYS